mmetsp:Transcript_5055/g.11007  ORF Transcript_5055/g.11007 Transcript_5055/m.11007 type:complete len:408 (+) Transcript_5055:867-2090(+)
MPHISFALRHTQHRSAMTAGRKGGRWDRWDRTAAFFLASSHCNCRSPSSTSVLSPFQAGWSRWREQVTFALTRRLYARKGARRRRTPHCCRTPACTVLHHQVVYALSAECRRGARCVSRCLLSFLSLLSPPLLFIIIVGRYDHRHPLRVCLQLCRPSLRCAHCQKVTRRAHFEVDAVVALDVFRLDTLGRAQHVHGLVLSLIVSLRFEQADSFSRFFHYFCHALVQLSHVVDSDLCILHCEHSGHAYPVVVFVSILPLLHQHPLRPLPSHDVVGWEREETHLPLRSGCLRVTVLTSIIATHTSHTSIHDVTGRLLPISPSLSLVCVSLSACITSTCARTFLDFSLFYFLLPFLLHTSTLVCLFGPLSSLLLLFSTIQTGCSFGRVAPLFLLSSIFAASSRFCLSSLF